MLEESFETATQHNAFFLKNDAGVLGNVSRPGMVLSGLPTKHQIAILSTFQITLWKCFN